MHANAVLKIRSRPAESGQLAVLARQALIAEVELTPKPGLVDRRGSGAHTDLTLDLMKRSAVAIEPFFAAMESVSAGRVPDESLRRQLAAIGREAEQAMYRTTRGVNTHNGAIWTLGLLIGAAARCTGQNGEAVADAAGSIARFQDRAQPMIVTHGDLVRRRYGLDGARGEAASGFPHVVRNGLQTRQVRIEGPGEQVCRLDALFSIMSQLDDTCILYRSGVEALSVTKVYAHAILMSGGCASAEGRMWARKLDRELAGRRISPGGSADLLAAAIFLDAVERETEVRLDQSEWEWINGKA